MKDKMMNMKLKDFIGAKVKYLSRETNRKRTGSVIGLRYNRVAVIRDRNFGEHVDIDDIIEVVE